MKKIWILLSFLIIKNFLFGQDTPYFSTTSMEDYIEINNPISVNNGEIWNEGSVYPIDFDFNFTVFDQEYSSLYVHAGGGISFPADGKGIQIYHTPFGGYLLKDKGVDSSLSGIDYEVVGEEGQYIIKIQWKNAGFVQWFSTSDTSDFVDFQIWIFQEDAHFELHFGDYQADPGTYGYPEGISDPDPGPSIKFAYDDCSNILSYYDAADNPLYDFFNMCLPPCYWFIDGTPSEGTTYRIIPNEGFVGISENDLSGVSVFPNPATDVIQIENINELSFIESVCIVDVLGNVILEFRKNEISGSALTLNIETIPVGVYCIRINSGNALLTKKLIKNSI
ncbi:protein containing Por secretion system C-terminal sorting domain [Lentimicrobium saccharophilum]|uniref:Protein containing Por secretion system C-terminal sorting domain n=1 Tax=Lentimicrobium saccharophilum TaxID=1678841 RepID=A0A0S7C1T6_9BACT|nr:T9SS type A sorting domain-containing protein [Lentimicrobium saccharophilum]GAP42936.1 protein containing Por secretion system C-terminal sorting domain [Lentimicrobium saccharophilum]